MGPAAMAWLLPIFQNAFSGRYAPRQEDGLAKLAVGNRNSAYGPMKSGLSGPDLVRYWSSLDPHTPDKMNQGRMDEMFGAYPGSPFAQWYQAIGAAPGGGVGKFGRGAAYQGAMGQASGTSTSWWNPNPANNSIFRGLMF